MDEGKDHLISGTLIQVVVRQCTMLLVPMRITIITRRWRTRMPAMKKGIWAKKVSENSGGTTTVPGQPCIRSTRDIIRNRGGKVVWPPHTQSGVFLNVRSWTLERCLYDHRRLRRMEIGMFQGSVFPTNTELVNSFLVCGLRTTRGTNTLPHVFVTMVVK